MAGWMYQEEGWEGGGCAVTGQPAGASWRWGKLGAPRASLYPRAYPECDTAPRVSQTLALGKPHRVCGMLLHSFSQPHINMQLYQNKIDNFQS